MIQLSFDNNYVKYHLDLLLLFFFPVSETICFLGFRGNFKPSWVKFFAGSAEEDLSVIEKYIPLQLEEYGCARVNTSKRKDLELLKQALRMQ